MLKLQQPRDPFWHWFDAIADPVLLLLSLFLAIAILVHLTNNAPGHRKPNLIAGCVIGKATSTLYRCTT